MTRPVEARIHMRALAHNLARVRAVAPHSRVMAVIKADGYGHGIRNVARALDPDAYGVACLEEALCLREAGIAQPIVLLEGFFAAAELPLIAQHDLDVVIHHLQQVETLERVTLSAPLKVWLKIDTGMHRLGVRPEAVNGMVERLNACRNVQPPIAYMTHFARADARDEATTASQWALFTQTLNSLPGPRSAANSGGLLGWPETHADWVRPGIMLYGASPYADLDGSDVRLEPAMTLCSRLIAVSALRRGDAVGYGGTWICPEDMPVGVVAIGYGDGYPRHAPAGTPVLVNGQRVSLIGRVSMDMITVDLRTLAQAQVGDSVVLWGEGLPVEEIARHAETIAYELLCKITPRVPRVMLT